MICLLTEEILGDHIDKKYAVLGVFFLVAICTHKLQLLYSVVLESVQIIGCIICFNIC